MLWNIVDHRTNKFCQEVDAVFEPAWHDNAIEGACQAEVDDTWSVVEDYNTTVREACHRAEEWWHTPVTVFLYDAGSQPLSSKQSKTKSRSIE